ncbi:DUF2637 domain-containing protein [Streptomyces sp. RKND-216]|uniref:DUF2637 domain-containing protein n=1 Tax=Streptomyces sp. RKND-216 TaxID=2562581 RepID=UPI001FF7005A|nr:DUF2637 domain-containing protein [Streptomyces sp. RKND-216]
MTQQQAERAAILTAGAVILVLTVAAFWLSYAHLADVAKEHGLASSPERAWAWPGTIDLFILAGEVLMFRAALRGAWDWWAFALTAAGSLGSIGLNVAGVEQDALSLEHVVAAVPPTAALLAFGALMRQVHGLVTDTSTADEPEHAPAALAPAEEPAPTTTQVEQEPAPVEPVKAPAPAPAVSVPAPLVEHARKLATAHQERTGAPMDTDTLRARLGVPAPMADAIAAQLT